MSLGFYQLLATVWWIFVPMTSVCIAGYAAGWIMGRIEERSYRARQAVRKAIRDRVAARKLLILNRTFARLGGESEHGR